MTAKVQYNIVQNDIVVAQTHNLYTISLLYID